MQIRKILRKQAIVEELHDEENTKTGEFDDKSKGVYSVGKKHGEYSREANNHGAGMSIGMEGDGDPNKEHLD